MAILLAIQGAASQGVLWGIMALGLYITFKVLDFADLTVDGSFALGGAVSAVLLVNGWNPFLSLLIAFLAGGISGVVTGLLHTKLEIPGILAGILTMIALYSINIRIMGQANTPLLGVDTIMVKLEILLGIDRTMSSLITGIVFSVVIIMILYWFFGTELGSVIRATGNNERMVRAQGVNTDNMSISINMQIRIFFIMTFSFRFSDFSMCQRRMLYVGKIIQLHRPWCIIRLPCQPDIWLQILHLLRRLPWNMRYD